MINSSVLALKLRPKRFSELVGQDSLVKEIQNQIASGRVPRAWMFLGEPGSGKTTISQIVSLALQKPDYADFGNNLTDEDWAMYPVYDILPVNASNDNGKGDMAGLVEKTQYGVMPPSRFRVIILNEAHSLTTQAQQLLLDATETDGNTVWIVVTSDPSKFGVAFHRRFLTYRLQPLGLSQIVEYMNGVVGRENLPVTAETVESLAGALYGAGVTTPGRCVRALEQVAAGASIGDAAGSISNGEADAKTVVKGLLRGEWDTVKAVLGKYSNSELMSFRYLILAWLKNSVISGKNGIPQKAAEQIALLTDGAPIEQPALVPWTISRFYMLANHKDNGTA